MRTLELMPVSALLAAPVNPKAHDEPLLAASVARFGFIEPIVLDERTGCLVAGHGRLGSLRARLEAGQPPPEGVELGVDGEWTVPVVRGWSSADDDDALAAGIALNRLTESGGWRDEELHALLAPLAELNKLAGVGFEGDELAALLDRFKPDDLAHDARPSYRGDGTHAEPSMADRLVNYRTNGVRSLVLDFPLPVYEVVAGGLARARASLSLESNSEVFAALLEPWK